jgi:SpoVK/Ycf46/Vps4 family AAA+-type ATPase
MCPKYRKLVDCEEIISEFNQMIGLEGPKSYIATQILSLCDRVGQQKPKKPEQSKDKTKKRIAGRKRSSEEDKDVDKVEEEPLLNTVFYGPPGCGKTTIANFLAKLYLKFGVLENGKIIKGDRASLIGQYVGETAIKTKKVLMQALGGVLFIDEAYQLGHAADGNRCPFAYECITTIMQFITQHKGRITVMLAGYKTDIQENFFAQNEGLDRRFPWMYTLERNKPDELVEIFKLQAQKSGYLVANDGEGCALKAEFFKTNEDLFKYSGGDTQTLFDKCKMVHDKRMFSCLRSDKVITKVDLDKGYNIYKKSKEHKSGDTPPQGMFS